MDVCQDHVKKGINDDVEVVDDPGYGFAGAAVEALKKSSFSPAIHERRPVTSKAILVVRFILQGNN